MTTSRLFQNYFKTTLRLVQDYFKCLQDDFNIPSTQSEKKLNEKTLMNLITVKNYS